MRDEGERPGGKANLRPVGGAARRDGARNASGGKRPGPKMARRQFHLSEKTAQRLGVHSTLVDRNESAVVEEILESWLGRYGKGRELFDRISGGREDSSPDTQEDRQDTTAA